MQVAQGQMTENDYFKMGAIVAIGELFDEGLLGARDAAAPQVRDYLRSFGICGFDDMRALGMGDIYINDFETLYEQL